MPKANPRQSTQSPRLAAYLLGHNERNRGSNSSSSDSSPSRSRYCRRHKRRRHSKRHHQDHNPLGAPLPSSTLHRGRKRAENTQRQQTSPFPRQSAPAPPGGTGAMQQLLPQWLSPMQLARRCATVSMLEGAIGPLSQAAEGLTLADPANTCPRTPPVATCMHELQQAMQDSLGCCQRRLYPCSLDTRRFPRRTARAVRAARYGDQPRFQAAGDGGGAFDGIYPRRSSSTSPYCTPVMLVSTDETAVRQTTQVPQLQQPLVQVELCASSEAVYCHLTSEGATGQTATTDIYKCSIMRAPAVEGFLEAVHSIPVPSTLCGFHELAA
ncbi:hypothetical protein EMCRGX_G030293 [Ephydatia muelleri]